MLLLYIRLDIFNSTIYSSLSLNCISSTLLLLCSSTSSSTTSNVFSSSKYKALPPISSNTSKELSYQSFINKINNNNTNDNKKKNKKNNKMNHQDVSLKPFNKQITYRLIEESNIPQFIGNLINDFQLTNYLLNYIFNHSLSSNNLKINTINQSKPLLSIDLIANQYQIINNNNNNNNNTDYSHYHYHELPRLYLFPSNQWSSKYFHINYYNLFKQELIQIKKLDRDQLCHWDHNPNPNNNQFIKEINTCLCSINTCSIINNQSNNSFNLPYCQFTITIAMNLLSIGIELMTIHIQLIDINDNYPIFQLFNKYELHFMEDALIGTKYQLPIAIDYDMCLYSNITYQLQSINHHEIDSSLINNNNNNNQLNQSINYFSLIFNQLHDHNRLEIQLDHNLDREQIDKYELNLLAIDNHYQLNEIKHTTTLPLIIYIHDVNDCKPEFTIIKSIINNNNHSNNNNEVLYQSNEPLLIEVCEDVPIGYIVTKFHAIDKDIGKNAEIQYRISQYTHSLTKSVSLSFLSE
ncbi:unnamed protein product [Schistosoma margrebowiei]|uniref:Uncharacterized protein n=1 Tax=Schistosoma margrebowiei TaxID=48269 RepID=A0A183LCL1_9TREM|nr:unnamed protein product [Schistosoma margrebowiei]